MVVRGAAFDDDFAARGGRLVAVLEATCRRLEAVDRIKHRQSPLSFRSLRLVVRSLHRQDESPEDVLLLDTAMCICRASERILLVDRHLESRGRHRTR